VEPKDEELSEDTPTADDVELTFAPIRVGSERIRSIRDVERLIRDGRSEAALAGLNKLAPKAKKSAYIRYLRGKLYFEKRWRTDALKNYAEAIRLNRAYRKNTFVIRHSIEALADRKTRGRARALLRNKIGRPAARFLRRAAKRHQSTIVRREAKKLARRMRGR